MPITPRTMAPIYTAGLFIAQFLSLCRSRLFLLLFIVAVQGNQCYASILLWDLISGPPRVLAPAALALESIMVRKNALRAFFDASDSIHCEAGRTNIQPESEDTLASRSRM